MSKRHTSHSVDTIMGDILTMNESELEELYGLEISENGTVYDLFAFREFSSLQEWATYMAELEDDDNYSSFTKIGGKVPFDDEY